jgi:hypothetical protein
MRITFLCVKAAVEDSRRRVRPCNSTAGKATVCLYVSANIAVHYDDRHRPKDARTQHAAVAAELQHSRYEQNKTSHSRSAHCVGVCESSSGRHLEAPEAVQQHSM